MILYVDMEHITGRTAPWGHALMAGRIKVKYRIEEITCEPCLIAHYANVTPEFVQQYPFRAILLSGSGTDPEHYTDLAGVNAVIQLPPVPILGMCGGWQFMAQALGAAINPLGPLPPGAPSSDDPVIFREGYQQEYGFHPVQITASHPLFDGLSATPTFWHAHYLEVNPIPPGFRIYAQTALCTVQMAAHDTHPLFGTQFHPEHYDDAHPDGRRLLENFFGLVGG
ncbi:MAG TPA: gamma-glutamyl-gamma-aminobutyrate hydrolase family protein [Anaerolineales bacterium]|nr:gamma-glutamyl-gamma-aminobutyrate hydrolase family protein [Anaerolineales bacterium]